MVYSLPFLAAGFFAVADFLAVDFAAALGAASFLAAAAGAMIRHAARRRRDAPGRARVPGEPPRLSKPPDDRGATRRKAVACSTPKVSRHRDCGWRVRDSCCRRERRATRSFPR